MLLKKNCTYQGSSALAERIRLLPTSKEYWANVFFSKRTNYTIYEPQEAARQSLYIIGLLSCLFSLLH